MTQSNVAVCGSGPEIPEKLAKFCHLLVEGQRPDKAARNAGFENPGRVAIDLIARDDVLAMIQDLLQRRLVVDGASIALQGLIATARNGRYPRELRVKVWQDLLSRAGFVPPKAKEAHEAGTTALARMSRDELVELAESARQVLSDRAVIIEQTRQTGAQRTVKAADLLG